MNGAGGETGRLKPVCGERLLAVLGVLAVLGWMSAFPRPFALREGQGLWLIDRATAPEGEILPALVPCFSSFPTLLPAAAGGFFLPLRLFVGRIA